MSKRNKNGKNDKFEVVSEASQASLYMHMILSSDGYSDLVERGKKILSSEDSWVEYKNTVKYDPLLASMSIMSMPKDSRTEGVATSLLMVSAVNTSSMKKEVVFTDSHIYCSKLTIDTFVTSNREKKFSPYDIVSGIERPEMQHAFDSISNSGAVIQVSEEVAMLHGSFCKDTWSLISSFAGQAATVRMYSNDDEVDDKYYGAVFLIGKALSTLYDISLVNMESDVDRLAEDFKFINSAMKLEEKEPKMAETSQDEGN